MQSPLNQYQVQNWNAELFALLLPCSAFRNFAWTYRLDIRWAAMGAFGRVHRFRILRRHFRVAPSTLCCCHWLHVTFTKVTRHVIHQEFVI